MKHYPQDLEKEVSRSIGRAEFFLVWVVLAFAAFGLIVTLAPISTSAREVLATGVLGRAFICAGISFMPTLLIAHKFC